ncbi:MAG: hypothetical protein ABR985_22285 [Methanotrichaceae archaeon]|jgi:hypothetical protein
MQPSAPVGQSGMQITWWVMMEKFKDIQSLYNYLEENAIDYYIHSKQIADLFRDLRETNSTDLGIAQWEIDCFNFVAKDGELKPLGIFTNEKGDRIEYPNLISFDENAYAYLANRLNSTTDPLLKSRYSHILWSSPVRHGSYAQIAVDSYSRLSEACEDRDRRTPNEHYGLYALHAIRNAFYMARQVNDKCKINMVKSRIKSMIFHFNYKSVSSFTLKTDLIRLMVKSGMYSKIEILLVSITSVSNWRRNYLN